MKKIILACIALISLASCSGNRYGCYKPGRCVDAAKPALPSEKASEVRLG